MRLDALVQLSVESASLAQQPAAPEEGQSWILPAGASGSDWSTMAAGSIAVYRDGFWASFEPHEGWQAWVRDEGHALAYSRRSSSRRRWFAAPAIISISEGNLGSATRSIVIEEEITNLIGASVNSTILIPNRAIVFCVSVRTVETVSGATSFDCGIAGEPSKFGGSLGVAAGASNLGVIGPQAFYADTPIVLTANDGDFAGGTVRIAIHALLPRAPD